MSLEGFLSVFEAMPAWQKLGWIVLCMSANLIVESVRPLFSGGFRSWAHTRTNLTFLATTFDYYRQGTHAFDQWVREKRGLQDELCCIPTMSAPAPEDVTACPLARALAPAFVAVGALHRLGIPHGAISPAAFRSRPAGGP